MMASELMSPISPHCWLRPDSLIMDAVEKFQKYRYDALPVVNQNGELIGVFTKRSLYKCLIKEVSSKEKIENYFISDVVSIPENQELNAISEIRNTPVGQWLLVNQKNQPVGILTKINIVLFLLNNSERLMTELTSILMAIPIGVIAIDNKGIVRHFNPAAVELLGKTSELIGEKPLTSVMDGFNLEKVLTSGKIQLEEGSPVDKRKVIFSGHPIRSNDEITGAIGVFQDLTELEYISQELVSVKRLQQTLETIIASVDTGLVVTDEKGTIVKVNHSSLVLLKKDQENVLGQEFKDIFGSQVVDMVLHKGSSEVDVGNINGQRFLMTANPIMESNAVVGSVTNIIFKNLVKLKNLIAKLDLLENQLNHYRKELLKVTTSRYNFDSILTQSQAMIRLKKDAMTAASGFSNILLLGESGTGKELFAQAIHDASPRRMFPFIKVNCAAIPETLLESELFGYDDGAFTGAKKGGKPGRFEMAQGGTIFLDEIGDMPLPLQAKILRVLQEKEFERVGGTETIQVDVRIIAATNMDLFEMVGKNKFRQDLYYRLNVISFRIPPLRERREDVIYIAEHFLRWFNQIMGAEVKGFTIEARLILENHDWPGNVRELANVVERAMNMNVKDLIGQEHLPSYLVEKMPQKANLLYNNAGQSEATNYRKAMEVYERSLMVAALRETGGNCNEASKLLGMSRSRFYEKIANYSIKIPKKGRRKSG